MKFNTNKNTTLTIFAVLLYLAFGILLFVRSFPLRAFDQERLIYDLIWLDGWSLAFVTIVVILWRAPFRTGWRIFSLLLSLSVYSLVFTAIVFDGTAFGLNAYWGDQQFRIAQVLHFMYFGWDTDFFYKNLPPFYPPLYYFCLSVYAKLMSVDAYKMMKIGLWILSVIVPGGLYLLWRKLVSPLQALLITFAAVLLTGDRIPFVFHSAHQYIGNMLFFPWWLYFVERVKNPDTGWRFYLAGGILGAVIFATYFYAFFMGGFLIVMRETLFRNWSFIRRESRYHLKPALIVLGLAAIFSAPYWLPLLVSIARFGMDRSRGGWFTFDSSGIDFEYMKLSWIGLIFLGGLIYSARRYRAPIHRSLLILVGSVVVFFLAGSILGALDISFNLTKARDFVMLAGVPISGLFLAAVLRWSVRTRTRRYAVAVILITLLMVRLNSLDTCAKDNMVKTARSESAPDWGTNPVDMEAATGTVFLSAILQVCSFYPVYTFIVNNEHYSHPASRFKERYDFLNLLQPIADPYVFYVALRYNVFDTVDYFMPSANSGRYQIPINISNYPYMYTSKTLSFPQSVTGDSALFIRRPGRNLFQLSKNLPERGARKPERPFASVADSLLYLERVKDISSYLIPEGRDQVTKRVKLDSAAFHSINIAGGQHVFADSIVLVGADAILVGDSIMVIFRFEARENISGDYRISLHLFTSDGARKNLDFSPATPTGTWGKWDIVYCYRMVPRQPGRISFDLGFFRREQMLLPVFHGRIAADFRETH